MNRLKLLRTEKQLSQADVGKIIGVSSQAIGLYENEKRDIPTNYLKELSKFFDVSIDYLLGKTDKRNNDNDKKELEINWALSGGYEALNDTNREIARSVIESLLAKQEQEKKEKK